MAKQTRYNTSAAWDAYIDLKRRWYVIWNTNMKQNERSNELEEINRSMENTMTRFTQEDWNAWYEQ